MEKKRILISAYAFNPLASLQLHPGEDTMGWKMVEQISREHDVWVITHSYNREGVLEALSRGEMPGVNIHFLELPSIFWKLYRIEFGQRLYYYLWQRSAWKKAERLHQELCFDLIHHLTFGNDWIPSFMGANLPIPFIWGPIGGGQKTPRGLSKEYSLYGRVAECVRRTAQWMGRRLPTRRRCVRNAKTILVCNQETKEKIPQKFRKKVRYFPVNGIDKNDIRIKPVKMRKQKKFRVITAGRMHRLKGFELAVKAFFLFAGDKPDAEMTIIGRGPEKEHVEKLIQELNLADRVFIQDWMQRKELLKQMKRSDVFLFASFRDGGGAVVVEAMASGLPVICINTAGPGFHVKEKYGIKIQPKSTSFVIDEMAKALNKLHNNEQLRAEMGEAARIRAKEYYEWTKLGSRMIEIYSKVLG